MAGVYTELRGFILAHRGCAGARHADLDPFTPDGYYLLVTYGCGVEFKVCSVPGALSLGCSFAALFAAHREDHSLGDGCGQRPDDDFANHRQKTAVNRQLVHKGVSATHGGDALVGFGIGTHEDDLRVRPFVLDASRQLQSVEAGHQ